MTRYRVVLVAFPFDDLTRHKVRPVLCLTDPLGPYRHVLVAFVSSRKPPEPLPTDLFLDSGTEGFFETGLRKSSTVQLHRLTTIRTSMIRQELGRLPHRLETLVRQRLKELLCDE